MMKFVSFLNIKYVLFSFGILFKSIKYLEGGVHCDQKFGILCLSFFLITGQQSTL